MSLMKRLEVFDHRTMCVFYKDVRYFQSPHNWGGPCHEGILEWSRFRNAVLNYTGCRIPANVWEILMGHMNVKRVR